MYNPSSSIRACFGCGFQQDNRYSYCGHCGETLQQQCQRCTQYVPAHFHYCGYCGQGLPHGQPRRPMQPQSRQQVHAPIQQVVEPPLETRSQPVFVSKQSSEPPVSAKTDSDQVVHPVYEHAFRAPIAEPEQPAFSFPEQNVQTPDSVSESKALTSEALPHSAVARVSERRQVAVLFCDVCGFTAMSESLDPEEVSNIIQPLFQACNQIINKYGGVVEKFIGDAIMALFGVPYLHEDDPERASMAALEMRDFIQDYGKKLMQSQGFSVNMRIGLNVGTVVAGSVQASEGMNYQVMGDAINTAARMEQNALPGHILVTESMYRLIKDSFELKTDKLIQAKGKAEPLQAYELLGIRRIQQRHRGLGHLSLPMVGRKEELRNLLQSTQQDLNKQQLIYLRITGESGLGKTRLAREVHKSLQVEHSNLHLLQTSTTSYSQHFSYFVLQNLIRSILEIDETWSHNDVIKHLQSFIDSRQIPNGAMIAALLEYTLYPHLELPKLKLISPERLQKQIFKAISDVLISLAEQAPLFILIDDLQWCDPVSLQWLQQFQQQFSERQLAIIFCVTLRANTTQEPPKINWQADQSLEPLNDEDCSQMICHILAIDPNDGLPFHLGSLGEAILTRAAGNPYYIEEVLSNLLEDQLLVKSQDNWELTCSLRELPLPSSIQRLIMSRFDRLSPQHRELLQTASALGNTANIQLLSGLLKQSEQELNNELHVLVQAGFLRLNIGPKGPECQFLQALTQEVIYNTMVNRLKLSLHQQIAETIEKQHIHDPYPALDLLAYHFSRTKDLTKASRYLFVAAEQSARLYANGLALEHFQRLLDILEQIDGQSLISTDLFQKDWLRAHQMQQRVIRRRVEVLLLTGAYDEVLNLVEQSLSKIDVPLELARLLYCRGRVQEKRAEYVNALQTYEEARQILQKNGDLREQARIWNAMAWVCCWQSDYDAAIKACESALALLEQQPDMEQLAYSHNVMGVVHYQRHDWEQALIHYRQSLEIQSQIQNLWGHANSLSNMGNVYFMTNRWQEAVDVYQQSLEVREQLGDTEGIANSCNNLGHALQELNQLQGAQEYLQRAVENFDLIGHRLGAESARCNLGSVAYRQRKWEQALSLLNPGIKSLEELNMLALLPETYNQRIEIYLEQELLQQALETLQNNQAAIQEYGDPVQKGRLQRLWGRYYRQSEQIESAKSHLDQALEILQAADHRGECLLLYHELALWHESQGSKEATYWQEAGQNLLAEESKNT